MLVRMIYILESSMSDPSLQVALAFEVLSYKWSTEKTLTCSQRFIETPVLSWRNSKQPLKRSPFRFEFLSPFLGLPNFHDHTRYSIWCNISCKNIKYVPFLRKYSKNSLMIHKGNTKEERNAGRLRRTSRWFIPLVQQYIFKINF